MHVLGRRRLQGGDESAVAGHVHDRDFQGRQALQGLGRDLDVAEDDDLADRRDRHALGFRAVLADDQVLAPLADVRAGLLKVEDRSFVALRQNAGDAGRGLLGRRRAAARLRQ